MSDPANDPPLVTRPADPPAPAKPRPGFGEAVLWCLLFVSVQVLGAVFGVLVAFGAYAVSAENPEAFVTGQLELFTKALDSSTPADRRPAIPNEFGQSLAWGLLAAQLAALALVLLVLPRRVGREWKRQLGVRAPAKLHAFVVVLIAPGFIVLPDLVQALFVRLTGLEAPDGVDTLRGVFRGFPWALTLLAVAVGPGVVEEFWCRGFLGRGLVARFGFVGGVALTSALFAVMHGNPAGLPAYVLMGAYLHFVYFATRSIWAPVLLHLLNNGTGVVLALVAGGPDPNAPTPVVLYIAAFGLMAFGTVALWTGRTALEPIDAKAAAWRPESPGVSAPPSGANARLVNEPVSPTAVLFALVSCGAVVYVIWRYLF